MADGTLLSIADTNWPVSHPAWPDVDHARYRDGRDDDRYLVVPSNGGAGSRPAWYLNLQAHPEVGVQVEAERPLPVADPTL